jgi:hypothetical protein
VSILAHTIPAQTAACIVTQIIAVTALNRTEKTMIRSRPCSLDIVPLETHLYLRYSFRMTLRERNVLFKIGIGIALVSVSVAVFALVAIFSHNSPVYEDVFDEVAQRSSTIIPHVAPIVPYAPFVSILIASVYAFAAIIGIYYFFEKTQVPEILFFAFFVLSFAFEVVRCMIPFKKIYELSSLYLIIGQRVLLFGRYFGIFSLFAASTYASGLDIQKQKNYIFVIFVVALILSLGIPVDGFSWNSSLSMVTGYSVLFKMIEISIALITLVSFLVAALSRDNREYIAISVGSLLVFLGRNLLLNADTWFGPVSGALLLGVGTWVICTKLHSVYLWL